MRLDDSLYTQEAVAEVPSLPDVLVVSPVLAVPPVESLESDLAHLAVPCNPLVPWVHRYGNLDAVRSGLASSEGDPAFPGIPQSLLTHPSSERVATVLTSQAGMPGLVTIAGMAVVVALAGMASPDIDVGRPNRVVDGIPGASADARRSFQTVSAESSLRVVGIVDWSTARGRCPAVTGSQTHVPSACHHQAVLGTAPVLHGPCLEPLKTTQGCWGQGQGRSLGTAVAGCPHTVVSRSVGTTVELARSSCFQVSAN